MAVIDEILSSRAFELVRDRIASLLADEISNQATLQSNPDLNATVYLERFIPFANTEVPAINVMLSRGEFGLQTSMTTDGNFSFDIDVYHSSKTTSTARGDTNAMMKLQRLTGLICAILTNQRYRTLGFTAPFIENTSLVSIKTADPVDNKDASSLVFSRIIFSVRVSDRNLLMQPTLISGYDTQVLLNGTLHGYIFSGNQLPLPTPTCEGSDILDSNGDVIGTAVSGGFFVVSDSVISNSDDSDVVSLPATQNLEIPDITYNIYINSVLVHSENGPNYFNS